MSLKHVSPCKWMNECPYYVPFRGTDEPKMKVYVVIEQEYYLDENKEIVFVTTNKDYAKKYSHDNTDITKKVYYETWEVEN